MTEPMREKPLFEDLPNGDDYWIRRDGDWRIITGELSHSCRDAYVGWRGQEVVKGLLSELPHGYWHRSEHAVQKLQLFKNWVHAWLDTYGVPKEFPDGPHSKEGCRIGDRLEWIKERMEKLQRSERENEDQLCRISKRIGTDARGAPEEDKTIAGATLAFIAQLAADLDNERGWRQSTVRNAERLEEENKILHGQIALAIKVHSEYTILKSYAGADSTLKAHAIMLETDEKRIAAEQRVTDWETLAQRLVRHTTMPEIDRCRGGLRTQEAVKWLDEFCQLREEVSALLEKKDGKKEASGSG